jgi:CheY-like chemotaxis protein
MTDRGMSSVALGGQKLPKRQGRHGLAYHVLIARNMGNTANKILIVDGNDNFRGSLTALIKGLGHEVFEACSGPEAIEKAASIRPNLIMMDVRLPGMNGDEVTAKLKSNRATRNIPVVINTGWTTACNVEDRIHRALNAGAAEIMYKPIQIPELRGVLRSYLLAC